MNLYGNYFAINFLDPLGLETYLLTRYEERLGKEDCGKKSFLKIIKAWHYHSDYNKDYEWWLQTES